MSTRITKTTATDSAGEIAAARAGRNWITVQNHSEDNTVWVAQGESAVTDTSGAKPGIKLLPGEIWGHGGGAYMPEGRMSLRGAFYAICSSGETAVVVVHEG